MFAQKHEITGYTPNKAKLQQPTETKRILNIEIQPMQMPDVYVYLARGGAIRDSAILVCYPAACMISNIGPADGLAVVVSQALAKQQLDAHQGNKNALLHDRVTTVTIYNLSLLIFKTDVSVTSKYTSTTWSTGQAAKPPLLEFMSSTCIQLYITTYSER